MTKMSAAVAVTANTSNMYNTFTINQLPEVTMNLTFTVMLLSQQPSKHW